MLTLASLQLTYGSSFWLEKSTNAPQVQWQILHLSGPAAKNFHLSLLIECWSFHPRLHLSRLAHLSFASSLGFRRHRCGGKLCGSVPFFMRRNRWPVTLFWPLNQVNHWMKSLPDIRFTKILFASKLKSWESLTSHITSKSFAPFSSNLTIQTLGTSIYQSAPKPKQPAISKLLMDSHGHAESEHDAPNVHLGTRSRDSALCNSSMLEILFSTFKLHSFRQNLPLLAESQLTIFVEGWITNFCRTKSVWMFNGASCWWNNPTCHWCSLASNEGGHEVVAVIVSCLHPAER